VSGQVLGSIFSKMVCPIPRTRPTASDRGTCQGTFKEWSRLGYRNIQSILEHRTMTDEWHHVLLFTLFLWTQQKQCSYFNQGWPGFLKSIHEKFKNYKPSIIQYTTLLCLTCLRAAPSSVLHCFWFKRGGSSVFFMHANKFLETKWGEIVFVKNFLLLKFDGL
jgi:hypothetical protein